MAAIKIQRKRPFNQLYPVRGGFVFLNLCGLYSPPLAAQNVYVDEFVHKSHNVTVLFYHLIFPAKYRRAVFEERVDETVKDVFGY